MAQGGRSEGVVMSDYFKKLKEDIERAIREKLEKSYKVIDEYLRKRR